MLPPADSIRMSRLALLIAAVLLAGCAGPVPSGSSPPVPPFSPAATPETTAPVSPSASPSATPPATAASDLDLLLDELERSHPQPFHGVPREEFVAQLEDLKGRIGDLSPEEATVEVMRLTGLLSRAGRDGHQFLVPLEGADDPVLPIRVFEFEGEVVITDAHAPHQDLAQTRIVQINGHPIADVLAAVEPLVPRDGPATVPGFRPIFMLRTIVLRGLGLADDGPVSVTVADASGAERTVPLEPMDFEAYQAWIGGNMTRLPARDDLRFLTRSDAHFWTEYLPAGRALYVRFGAVQAVDPFEVDEMLARASQPDVDKVIVDLRHNGGGENGSYRHLLETLRQDAIDQPNRLFVITDRLTFSAASNFATEIERWTDATFVGEPMGGGLNFWNDVRWLELEALPIPARFGISLKYWEFSTPDDPRLTIEPQIPVTSTAADYFGGRDAALEAILALP